MEKMLHSSLSLGEHRRAGDESSAARHALNSTQLSSPPTTSYLRRKHQKLFYFPELLLRHLQTLVRKELGRWF